MLSTAHKYGKWKVRETPAERDDEEDWRYLVRHWKGDGKEGSEPTTDHQGRTWHCSRRMSDCATWRRRSVHSVSSVAQSCPTLCNPMNHSSPGLPVHHQLLEFTQTQVHQVGDAIQPSHPLLSPSPPSPNPSQHQGLFQWVNSSHEVAKVLEFQL